MEFELSDTHRMMADTARKVGERFGLEYWRERDTREEFAADFWQAVCDAGLCGVALPTEYGGSGLGMVEMALIIERLAAAGGGSTVGQLFMNNPIFGGVAISKFGSEEVKRAYLPKLASGEMRFAMALTEPDAGSNTLSMKTFAARDGNDGWRIDGSKIWITCVPQAHKILVVARTMGREDVKRRSDGISMFLIDVDREGLTHSSIEKLGTHTNPSSLVYFDSVKVRRDELIGTLDQGWHELLHVLNTERIVTTACLVGTGELALRLAADYAGTRKIFDRPIGAYQGLQFPLAQAYAQLECARLINYKAAWLHDRGLPYGSESNIGKLIASQAATAALDRAMQTMGGMGYAKEMHLERLWRDARLFRFAPVSEEMILNYLAVHDLGMPRGY